MLAISLLAAEATAEVEKVANPILPVGKELFWGAATFFLLYALMKFVLLPPVVKVMHERENRLRADRQAVTSMGDQVSSEQSAYDTRLAQARSEADRIIGAVRDEADGYRAQRFAEVNAEIAELRAVSAAEVATAKTSAMASLKGDLSSIAVRAASGVVRRELDVDTERAGIEAFVNAATGDKR